MKDGNRAQRILLAEDDDALRTLLAEVLTEAGHAVTTAHTANALERAVIDAIAGSPSVHFDLLITDLHMPGTDTFAVLERLGNAGVRPPTLVLSAFADDAALVEAYRIGCLCMLAKPFDMDDLLLVVTLLGESTRKS